MQNCCNPTHGWLYVIKINQVTFSFAIAVVAPIEQLLDQCTESVQVRGHGYLFLTVSTLSSMSLG